MINTSTEFVNGGKHKIRTGIETFYQFYQSKRLFHKIIYSDRSIGTYFKFSKYCTKIMLVSFYNDNLRTIKYNTKAPCIMHEKCKV